VGVVGTLSAMSFAEAEKAAIAFVTQGKLSNPLLVLEVYFKPEANEFGLTEYAYAPAEMEWLDLQSTIDLCTSDPRIHVVDGNRFCTGI
jgi:hypothetical protein